MRFSSLIFVEWQRACFNHWLSCSTHFYILCLWAGPCICMSHCPVPSTSSKDLVKLYLKRKYMSRTCDILSYLLSLISTRQVEDFSRCKMLDQDLDLLLHWDMQRFFTNTHGKDMSRSIPIRCLRAWKRELRVQFNRALHLDRAVCSRLWVWERSIWSFDVIIIIWVVESAIRYSLGLLTQFSYSPEFMLMLVLVTPHMSDSEGCGGGATPQTGQEVFTGHWSKPIKIKYNGPNACPSTFGCISISFLVPYIYKDLWSTWGKYAKIQGHISGNTPENLRCWDTLASWILRQHPCSPC